MIVRTKNGDVGIRSRIDLLDYLRGITGKGGEVKEDVSVIVPVALSGTVEHAQGNVEVFPWTFSTYHLDRYDERIDPQGWELDHYKSNPVIQWAHRWDIPAIGKAADLFADDDGLHGNIVFNDKAFDAFGWAIGERVKAGVLRAGSVGFRVLEVELPEKQAQADGTSLIFRKQELLEFSICNVPANPWALSRPPLAERKQLGHQSQKNFDGWGFLGFDSYTAGACN